MATSGQQEKRKKEEAPPVRHVKLFAKRFVVNIHTEPNYESARLGYLRAGAVVAAQASPVSTEGCKGGWYQLTTRGYICATNRVIPFEGDKLPEMRAAQPDSSRPLPYVYAHTRKTRSPMYRRLPSKVEADFFEHGKVPQASKSQSKSIGGSILSRLAEQHDAGVAEPVETSAGVSTSEAEGELPPPTLDSLLGGDASVLRRSLEKGFLVSLDKKYERHGREYWRTMSNGFVPARSLYLLEGSAFSGGELKEAVSLPYAFVLTKRVRAYQKNDKGRLRSAGRPEYHDSFAVVDEQEHQGRKYVIDPEGKWYEARRVAVVRRQEPPESVGDGQWIDIDLERQSLVAYQGRTPVYVTMISSGRVQKLDDPLLDHRTPQGTFQITSKHVTHTMDGDHAVDGPYSIEDVPYVMYFQLAYAVHSAFWHNRFGRPKSHGCVNMAPRDAKWLFEWSEPHLPKGWHGVFPQSESEATTVVVRGETPKR